MGEETFKMTTLDIVPFAGTTVYGQNIDDQKWVFIRSNYYYPLHISLWCDNDHEQKTEIKEPYGIAGFLVPDNYIHHTVSIGVSYNDEDWHWIKHCFHTGATY